MVFIVIFMIIIITVCFFFNRTYIMSIVNGLLELQGSILNEVQKDNNNYNNNKNVGFFDCVVYGFTNREFRKNFAGIKAPFQVIFSPLLLPFATAWAVYLSFPLSLFFPSSLFSLLSSFISSFSLFFLFLF